MRKSGKRFPKKNYSPPKLASLDNAVTRQYSQSANSVTVAENAIQEIED
jgi:hypothetical protein